MTGLGPWRRRLPTGICNVSANLKIHLCLVAIHTQTSTMRLAWPHTQRPREATSVRFVLSLIPARALQRLHDAAPRVLRLAVSMCESSFATVFCGS